MSSNSAFVPKAVKSFRLVRQLGSTHHSQKSVVVQSEPRLNPLLKLAKEQLFQKECEENANLEVDLFYQSDFGLEPVKTEENLQVVLKKYGKYTPTLKVELSKAIQDIPEDITTVNLFRMLLTHIADSNHEHADVAKKLMNNVREMDQVFDLYLKSCRHMVPTALEKNTLALWMPSMEKFIDSTLLHRSMASKRVANDSAVFGSSFSLKRLDDKPLKSNGIPQSENTIITGPVLGLLTPEGRLRMCTVLKKGLDEQQMYCSLVPANQLDKDVITQQINLKGAPQPQGNANIIEFKNLQPRTPYVTIWTGFFNSDDHIAQFETFPTTATNQKIVVLSSLTNGNYKQVHEVKPNIVLHLDHVDATSSWIQAEEIMRSYPDNELNPKSVSLDDRIAIRNAFRNVYFSLWKEKHAHSILSNYSNYFAFSRRFIRSDFGSKSSDITPHSKQLFIAEQARFVYWELLRDLNEPFMTKYSERCNYSHEGNFFNNGSNAVLLLDTVTASTFLNAYGIEDGTSVLGAQQWNFIEKQLKEACVEVKHLCVIVDYSFIAQGSNEAVRLLTQLYAWKKQVTGRDVTIFSNAEAGGAEYSIMNASNTDIATWIITSSRRGSQIENLAPELEISNFFARRRTATANPSFSVLVNYADRISSSLKY